MNVEELPFLLGDIYLAEKKLSQGSFGTVYHGVNLDTKQILAIKIERENPNSIKSYTSKEISILQRLHDIKGIPKLLWFNEVAIVLSLLGKDLSAYLKIFKKFSQKTIMMVTFQIICILENIHNKGVLHRDLKPENILVGRELDNKQIYLIDYGISKMVDDLKDLTYKENKSFVGTARYASVSAHKGLELNRKDDLESLFYVMIYCAKGTLPWQKINASEDEKILRVGKLKEELTILEICQGMPMQFIEAFVYIKKLNFKDEVDYDRLKKLIIKFSDEEEFEMDNIFDWISPFQLEKKVLKKKIQTLGGKQDTKIDNKMIKIHKTKTDAHEDHLKTNKFGSQESLITEPMNNTIEKNKTMQQNTSRFQKLANELLTIPGSESLQISENNSSINLSRCSSMQIHDYVSEESYS